MDDAGRSASRFATTSWTLIVQARSSPEALRVLLERYWSPVYAFYRRMGEPRENATDLTQGFLTRLIDDGRLLEAADPERGRFRSFLKQALRNHRVDEIRCYRGRAGADGHRFVPTDTSLLEQVEPDSGSESGDAFDRQWAATTLSVALTRLEAACDAEGLERHWEVFRGRVLNPLMSGGTPEAVDALVERLDLRSAVECSKILYTVKRKFRETLRAVVAETVDEADLDDELRLVQTSLG